MDIIHSQEAEINVRKYPVTIVRVLFFFLSANTALAAFTGPVISVLDGDTIEVLHNTYPERIRLSSIDCPEKGQAFGTRASRLRQP